MCTVSYLCCSAVTYSASLRLLHIARTGFGLIHLNAPALHRASSLRMQAVFVGLRMGCLLSCLVVSVPCFVLVGVARVLAVILALLCVICSLVVRFCRCPVDVTLFLGLSQLTHTIWLSTIKTSPSSEQLNGRSKQSTNQL
jgi:hypothetical protein